MTSRSRLEARGVEPTFAGPIAAIMVHGGTSVRGRLYRVQCPCTRCDPPVRKWWLQNTDLCLRQAKVHTYVPVDATRDDKTEMWGYDKTQDVAPSGRVNSESAQKWLF